MLNDLIHIINYIYLQFTRLYQKHEQCFSISVITALHVFSTGDAPHIQCDSKKSTINLNLLVNKQFLLHLEVGKFAITFHSFKIYV